MAIGYYADRIDVLDTDYVAGTKSIDHTAQVVVAASSTNLSQRQLLYVENVGNSPCYFGPTGVSASGSNQGGKLLPSQFFWISAGPTINMYVICDTDETTTLIIQEWS